MGLQTLNNGNFSGTFVFLVVLLVIVLIALIVFGVFVLSNIRVIR